MKGIGYAVNLRLIGFRCVFEYSLKAEAFVCSVLNRCPYIVIGNVELSEEGAVLYIGEFVRADTLCGILDKELHHIHAFHIGIVTVHSVYGVLP